MTIENTSFVSVPDVMSSFRAFRLHPGENHVSHDVTRGHGFPASSMSEMLEPSIPPGQLNPTF